MVSFALIVPPHIFKYSAAFIPQGVQMIIPSNARFFHDAVDLMTGFLPFGAQVVKTNGLSETPDSS